MVVYISICSPMYLFTWRTGDAIDGICKCAGELNSHCLNRLFGFRKSDCVVNIGKVFTSCNKQTLQQVTQSPQPMALRMRSNRSITLPLQ